MSIFASKLNMVTGQVQWVPMDDAFDYSQQIARSAYADMLHDNDRNVKYHQALKSAVKKVHDLGKKAIVLDIGTGTGILSMMAARCGADEVYACEFFGPMSHCAEKIIALNKLDHKIKVIHKGSTQITVGKDGDLPYRANILVTEVFDTELIGEGAVKTYTHAQRELMEDNAIYIPSNGRVYATVFYSDCVNYFNKLNELYDGVLKIPPLVKNCAGSASVHDIQLSQLPVDSFQLITEPIQVLSFDWSGKIPIKRNETFYHTQKSRISGVAHGVFMWWDLIMEPDGEIILTCAPKWGQPQVNEYPWRDHWMQAIYYFKENPVLKNGQEFTLITNHDEFSLWFDVNLDSSMKSHYDVPICDCGLHLASRQRIGMLNDRTRQKKYIQTLKPLVTNRSICLNVSECSLLGMLAAVLGAKKVYCYETNRIYRGVLHKIAEFNKIDDRLHWCTSIEEIRELITNNKDEISLLLSEPYFSSSILPWHNLQFWYMKNQLSDILPEGVATIPKSVEFYLMAVRFEDLWKIRAPVTSVEGFDLQPFDKIIQQAITITDETIDAQPLWEYPCIALSKPHKFMELNFNDNVSLESIISTDKLQIEKDGICNGIVLWVKWNLSEDENININTGPIEDIVIGQKVIWDLYSKQGVYFLNPNTKLLSSKCISYSIKFHVSDGYFEYSFML